MAASNIIRGKVDKDGVTQPLTVMHGTTVPLGYRAKDSAGLPVNVTGYGLQFHFKLDIDDELPLIDISTANGRVTVNAADGLFQFVLDGTDMDKVPFAVDEERTSGPYAVYMTTPDGQRQLLRRGVLTFVRGV